MTILQFPTNKVLRDNLKTDSCLDQAKIIGLEDVVIVGFTKDGKFFFSASEDVTNERSLYLLESGKKYIFEEL